MVSPIPSYDLPLPKDKCCNFNILLNMTAIEFFLTKNLPTYALWVGPFRLGVDTENQVLQATHKPIKSCHVRGWWLSQPVFHRRLHFKQQSYHNCHSLYICRGDGGQGPKLLAISHQDFLSVHQHLRFLSHECHFEHVASHLVVTNNLLTYCALHTNIHCFKNIKVKPEVLILCVYIHIYIQKYIHIYMYIPCIKLFPSNAQLLCTRDKSQCCTCKRAQ